MNELNQFTKKQLMDIAEYYGISVYKSDSKKKLIKKLEAVYEIKDEEEAPQEEIQKSARIRRIHEQNKTE